MAENGNGLRNNIQTPREIRRNEYEKLKELFELDVTFEDILSPSRNRWVSFIRQVLTWAQAHSGENGSRTHERIAQMYNRTDGHFVNHATAGLRRDAIRSKHPVFDELLELFLETSCHIVRNQAIPSVLTQRIEMFMRLHTPEDVFAEYRGEPHQRRREGRQSKVLALLQAGTHVDEIVRDTGLSEWTINKYKRAFENTRLIERAPRKKRGKMSPERGIDSEGNSLRALDVLDRHILRLSLEGKNAEEISAELKKYGFAKSRFAVIGRAYRTFGGLEAISAQRLIKPSDPEGEWIYLKPPKK